MSTSLTRRLVTPAALVALGLAARLPSVWRAPLWQDEVASARILREPTLVSALHRVVRTESTPPLWYVLAWLVHHAGVPIVEVRLVSVAFGGALVLVVFRLASTFLTEWESAAAAVLVALGGALVFHGSELRAYEQLALVAALLALVVVRSLAMPSRRLDVALAAVVAAGVLTHYYFAFSLLTTLSWLWLDPRARAIRRRGSIAMCCGSAVVLPWLPAFAAQYEHDRFWWIGRYSARLVVETPLRLLAPLGLHQLLFAVALLGAVVGGAVAWRAVPEARLVTALAVAPLVIAAAVWSSGERVYAVRNLIEIAPFVAIVAVAGIAALPRPACAVALAATVVAAGWGWWWQPVRPGMPYSAIASALVAHGWQPTDPIAVHGNFFAYRAPLEWYLPHSPRLDVSRPTSRPCAVIFVIAPLRDGGFSVRRARGARRLKGLTLLATRRAAGCVRLSHDPRLEPLA